MNQVCTCWSTRGVYTHAPSRGPSHLRHQVHALHPDEPRVERGVSRANVIRFRAVLHGARLEEACPAALSSSSVDRNGSRPETSTNGRSRGGRGHRGRESARYHDHRCATSCGIHCRQRQNEAGLCLRCNRARGGWGMGLAKDKKEVENRVAEKK